MQSASTRCLSGLLAIFALLSTTPLYAGEHEGQAKGKEPQKAAYPLNTCPVSGEKLGGEMGPPVVYQHEGRTVKFCCKGCVKKFKKDPAKYLKKLDAAVIAQQKKSYPLKACVVSGEALGEDGPPIDYVHGNRLVRFCCKGCVKKFKKDPAKFLKKLDAAAKKGPAPEKKAGAHKEGSRGGH